jgi:uncharacterized protein DUF1579
MKNFFRLISILPIAVTCHGQEGGLEQMLRDLDVLVGEWNVKVEARLSPQGPWDTSVAWSIIQKTAGGRVIEEDITGSRQSRPFAIKCLLAINNQTLKYQRIFVDSEHGTLIDFVGNKKDKDFIFDKEWIYANQSKVKLRVVYKTISPDEFVVENMRMPDGSSAWDITGRMRYTRVLIKKSRDRSRDN